MEIIMRPVGSLKPYEKNPRKNAGAVDAGAASIKEFGFKVPCVITQDGVIVAGHTRKLAAEKLGLKEVPCIIAGDLVNDIVFRRMKAGKKGMQGFAGRAIVSSLLGEAIDSMVFIPVGFLGLLPLKDMLIMAGTQVVLKVAYEAIIIPLTTYITRKVGDYERANE